jgi:oxygen-independent coproporphyrinogen-3 oxidase
MAAMTAGGLYVHLPFCHSICPYCDFAVLTGRPQARERFVECLLEEIALQRGFEGGFDTLYFGGGTPSLLTVAQLERILAALRAHFVLAPGTEIFLEANPEDVEPERAAAWRELGVGFLSLGMQSLDDAELRFLGRRHDAATARRALAIAGDAGFRTVSADLIFGLPGQRWETLERSLTDAVELEIDHLSGYQLEVHEATHFGRRRREGRLFEMPDEDQGRLFGRIHERLGKLGLAAYEVSNFASAAEHRSRHNRKYWRREPYLGLGPAAHSFDGRRRWWNHSSVAAWSAAVERGERPVEGEETLSAADAALEELMLGLRTAEGVDLKGYSARYGVDLVPVNEASVAVWEAAGLVLREGGRLRPTVRGLAVADTLAARLDTGLASDVSPGPRQGVTP